MKHKEPESRKTTDAEIITVVLLAAGYFAGNIEKSLSFVRCTGLMPTMLGKSRFNRRMHQIGELLSELFFYTGQAIKELNLQTVYSIDSFPVAVCQNIRIANCRIVKGEEYRGKCVSKRVYFYGFKVHMIVTSGGIPVEFTFTTGSKHDLDGLKQLPVNLPEGSEVLADSAYTEYLMEEMLLDNGSDCLQTVNPIPGIPITPVRSILYLSEENRWKPRSPISPNICLKRFMRLLNQVF